MEQSAPKRLQPRIEKLEPKVANCSTLSLTPAPNSALVPATLADEPTLKAPLNERQEPVATNVKQDKAEPKRAIDLTLQLEPIETFWITLSLFTEDKQAAPKIDMVLPVCTAHLTLIVDPRVMN
jgi:hypothetical protein